MIVSIKEEQKALEYQETMKVDIVNIPKAKRSYGDQYIGIHASFYAKTSLFHRNF